VSKLSEFHPNRAMLQSPYFAATESKAQAWDLRMIYESNSIEGSTLTKCETEALLSNDATAEGKLIEDHLKAVDLAKAWSLVRLNARIGRELGESDLLGIYKILTAKSYPRPFDALMDSRLAAIAKVSGGSSSVPENHGDLFMDLPTDPRERAARIHHRITVQDRFAPVSRKVARLAMNFVLLSSGYPPVSISPELRTTYYAALEAADAGDFPAWLAFITTRLNEEFDWWLEALSESAPHASSAVPEN
jgi:hypothetical protein